MNWVTAAAAVVVTAVLGFFTARRAAYERVNALLAGVAEGPAAGARHRIGWLFYKQQDASQAGPPVSLSDEERSARIEDLFTVLWAATRIDALRQSLGHHRLVHHKPHELLKDSLAGWSRFWLRTTDIGTHQEQVALIQAVADLLTVSLDEDDARGINALRAAWSLEENTVDVQPDHAARAA